jgi:hypothetical protein
MSMIWAKQYQQQQTLALLRARQTIMRQSIQQLMVDIEQLRETCAQQQIKMQHFLFTAFDIHNLDNTSGHTSQATRFS